MSQFSERVRELFPDRHIYIRTGGKNRYFSLAGTTQAAGVAGLAGLLAAGAVALVFTGRDIPEITKVDDLTRFEADYAEKLSAAEEVVRDKSASYEQKIRSLQSALEAADAAQQEERNSAESRYGGLSDELASVTTRLESARSRAETERVRSSALEEQIAGLRADLTARLDQSDAARKEAENRAQELTVQLDQSDAVREEAEIRGQELAARLEDLQANMASQRSRTHSLETELQDVAGKLDAARMLQLAALEPTETEIETDRTAKQQEMEERVADLLKVEDGLIGQLEKSVAHDLAFVEGVVRHTGLDVEDLMKSVDPDSAAIGGPFLDLSEMRKVTEIVPARPEVSERIDDLNYQLSRLSWLEIALKSMPLAAPAENVRTTSGFGKRSDPFTRKSAFHSGLDFAGAAGTDIRATGPGVVVFAGRRSSYGWFIEIDHGHGIRTRYAHMASLDVKTGDRVDYLQTIGKMGSSGRSTGIHLHYEVSFNGKYFDPKRFIEAGRDVFKIQNQDTEGSRLVNAGR